MQGQRNFVQPLHESFELDCESNSSSSGMNQQVLWNNMLFNPVEIQSMTDCAVSSDGVNIPCLNMANQDGTQLGNWSLGGSSSSQHSQIQGGHEENKLEHEWTPPATVASRGGPRLQENHFEASHALSLENVNISHSTTQTDGIQTFPQNYSCFNNRHQNVEHVAVQVGIGNELSEPRLSHHPYLLGFLDPETVPSSIGLSNPGESSSEGVGFLREDDERAESSFDGRRLSCKRKNSDGFPGQSSASGNASSSHQSENSLLHSRSYNPMTGLNISSSSGYPSVGHSIEEHTAGFGTFVGGMAFDCYPSASAAGNVESLRRNYRLRINRAQPHDVSLRNSWSASSVGQSDIWSPNQPPSRSISLNHFLEPASLLTTSSSASQTHIPVVPALPQIVNSFPWNRASSSRIGSSSGPFSSEDRSITAREGNDLRNMPVTSNLDLVPATDVRNMTQGQANWSLSSGSISMVPSSQAVTNSGLHPTFGSSWVPHQNLPTRYPQPLAEAIHPGFFPPGSSDSGGQGTNFALQHSAHPLSSQEVAQQIRTRLHGPHPTSHIRSTTHLLRRRNDGLFSAPLPMRSLTAAGEERSRMLSEIRHALESLRHGDGLRFEDVFILDQTLILAGSDLHDRHRDMRLDVDNMSYEELLALEERIGNVCTGLSEETILKSLKQQKHSSAAIRASMEHKPCCICQEEYVEGDDLGTLDCGHDFHSVCIKQWLMHKNLCPICKNTALIT
ncbi:unnamed protein product [Musa acuminata subsp. malaccensis]|uniref:RING-type E3 ubiquitin transferase n=1 Tax=Musa acuminata subsp. malaccensis TaxID=214687 RepID=A0A804KI97_MUSAM|nr:PREDICTED: probable E3 ubiquitin-protein ligase HIP1 isoform X1 [Musa acuminata subsp. malaccensis]XP_009417182.1 PREDICTED: probable E3 ubiquitin-protein ligase HIP1 isoform X1 [Musa acuminata subsp. malaccensis]CAG1834832.1 unnamed protein product [Musa acuminata subsp. malaccensis]